MNEPIAIIGISLRLSGNINNKEDFWKILSDGKESTSPSKRWKEEPYVGYFMDESSIFNFPNKFFLISKEEAIHMDPQHRLLLICSQEALDDAYQSDKKLKSSDTGVFFGIMNPDYLQYGKSNRYTSTGNNFCMAANRIDTACSSSLHCIHLAANSLRGRETNLALAGGINLCLAKGPFESLNKLGVLSPSGRCKTFDSSANGYSRGEGVGVVVLKRLSDAIKDNDRIYSVLLSSGVNQNGRSGGTLTGSSVEMQSRLMKKCMYNAGVKPESITFMEAHGTGTKIGDPAECKAFSRVFGERINPIPIGSVKSNIGHLETGAGLLGFIKVCLCILKKSLVPSLHFDHATVRKDYIDFEKLNLRVLERLEKVDCESRNEVYAGVNSFGYGGSNAFCLLRGFESEIVDPPVLRNIFSLTFSAKTLKDLKKMIIQNVTAIEQCDENDFQRFCYSTRKRMKHLHSLNLVGKSKIEIQKFLKEFCVNNVVSSEKERILYCQEKTNVNRKTRIVYVFPGQGSFYSSFAIKLMESEEIFRKSFEELDIIIGKESDISILRLLEESRGKEFQNATGIGTDGMETNLLIFSIQYSYCSLLKERGVFPVGVIGHSVGEICASTICGLISVEEAVKIIFCIAKEIKPLFRKGSMMVVRKSIAFVENFLLSLSMKYLSNFNVDLACINDDNNVTLAGSSESLMIVEKEMKLKKIYCSIFDDEISFPYHSKLMKKVKENIICAVDKVFQIPRKVKKTLDIKFFSSIRMNEIPDVRSGEFWASNICEAVDFVSSTRKTLMEMKGNVFIEISPFPVLSSSISSIIQKFECESNEQRNVLQINQVERGFEDMSLDLLLLQLSSVGWVDGKNYGCHLFDIPFYPFETQPLLKGLQNDVYTEIGGCFSFKNNEVDNEIEVTLSTETDGRQDLGFEKFVEIIAEVAHVKIHDLSIYEPISNTGIDSLLAMKLKSRLFQIFGVEIDVGVVLSEKSLKNIFDEYFGKDVVDSKRVNVGVTQNIEDSNYYILLERNQEENFLGDETYPLDCLSYKTIIERGNFCEITSFQVVKNKKEISLCTNCTKGETVSIDKRIDLVLFSGQGVRLSKSTFRSLRILFSNEHVFRDSFNYCSDLVAEFSNSQVRIDKVFHEDVDVESFQSTRFLQPLIVSFQIAIVQLLKLKYKIDFSKMRCVGHSLGEVMCLFLNDVFDIKSLLSVIVVRSQLMVETATGLMMVIYSKEQFDVQSIICDFKSVRICLRNGKNSFVVGGNLSEMMKLKEKLEGDEMKVRILETANCVFHHPEFMEPLKKVFFEEISKIQSIEKGKSFQLKIPFYSNARGRLIDRIEDIVQFLFEEISQPVLFYEGISSLLDGRDIGNVFEIGLGNSISTLIKNISRKELKYFCVLQTRNNDGTSPQKNMLEFVANCWMKNERTRVQGSCKIDKIVGVSYSRKYFIVKNSVYSCSSNTNRSTFLLPENCSKILVNLSSELQVSVHKVFKSIMFIFLFLYDTLSEGSKNYFMSKICEKNNYEVLSAELCEDFNIRDVISSMKTQTCFSEIDGLFLENIRTQVGFVPDNHERSYRFDFECFLKSTEDTIEIFFNFSENFGKEVGESFKVSFEEILIQLHQNPLRKLQDIFLVTEDTHKDILELMTPNYDKDIEQHDDFLGIILEIIRKYPLNNAASNGEVSYTYQELDERSNILANTITEKLPVIPKNGVIAVYSTRNHQIPVCYLACLKLGCCYLPIDADIITPALTKRLEFFVKDSKPILILAESPLLPAVDHFGVECISYDRVDYSDKEKCVFERKIVDKSDLWCYLRYTSGSSGKPKGVVVTQSNVVSLLSTYREKFLFNSESVSITFHSISFDLSSYEVFGCLCNGGCVFFVPSSLCHNSVELMKTLRKEKITHLSMTPNSFYDFAFWEDQVKESKNPFLKMIMICGEALYYPKQELKMWFQKYDGEFPVVVNSYGITETTIISTYKRVEKKDVFNLKMSSIGIPFPNNNFVIVGKNNEILPPNSIGELNIFGDAVSTVGYLNKEDETKRRFIQGETVSKYLSGRVLYKTGDLVYFNITTKSYIFVDRIFGEFVKTSSGHRIDVKEIEEFVKMSFSFRFRVVVSLVPIEKEIGGKILCCFIECSQNNVDKVDIVEFLRSRVPGYCIPQRFVFKNNFPLSPNRKVNVKLFWKKEILD